jgi:Uma2 family endonuclease
MPSLNHSVTQSRLIVELSILYRKTYTFLSELSLAMTGKPDTVPDICTYLKMQVDFLHDRTSLAQMPLTVIEIISPSQTSETILAKFERYFQAGVKSCWLVMPVFKTI